MEQETIKISSKVCRNCRYYWGTDSGKPICRFYLDTGIRHGTPEGYCNKYEWKKMYHRVNPKGRLQEFERS